MPEIEYEGKVKEVKIVEKNTGDTDSKEAEVTISIDDDRIIVIKKLHWSDAKAYTPKDDVTVTVKVTQTKLTK